MAGRSWDGRCLWRCTGASLHGEVREWVTALRALLLASKVSVSVKKNPVLSNGAMTNPCAESDWVTVRRRRGAERNVDAPKECCGAPGHPICDGDRYAMQGTRPRLPPSGLSNVKANTRRPPMLSAALRKSSTSSENPWNLLPKPKEAPTAWSPFSEISLDSSCSTPLISCGTPRIDSPMAAADLSSSFFSRSPCIPDPASPSCMPSSPVVLEATTWRKGWFGTDLLHEVPRSKTTDNHDLGICFRHVGPQRAGSPESARMRALARLLHGI